MITLKYEGIGLNELKTIVNNTAEKVVRESRNIFGYNINAIDMSYHDVNIYEYADVDSIDFLYTTLALGILSREYPELLEDIDARNDKFKKYINYKENDTETCFYKMSKCFISYVTGLNIVTDKMIKDFETIIYYTILNVITIDDESIDV